MARKKKQPDPAEQAIEQAGSAGAVYAQEQLAGDYFRDWVRDQVDEAEAMRQKNPSSVFDDPKQIAKNMLQQLRWDIHRDMDARDLRARLSAIDTGDADVPERELRAAFFDGLDAELEAPSVREWLADEVKFQMENAHEQAVNEVRRGRSVERHHPRHHVCAAEPYLQHGERVRIRIRQPFEAFWYTIPSAMTPSEVALHFAQTGHPGMIIEIKSGGLKWAFQQGRFAGAPTVTPVI